MKTGRKLPQRDLELLSAYIDGQLDDRQMRTLETRLRKEPELKRELQELRATVQSLRDLPVPQLTRHFTLTPEMVGQGEVRRGFPALRFATALAGLAFITLVGLEGLLSVSGSEMAARAPAVMQEVELAQDAISAAEEPMAAAPVEEPAPELEMMEVPTGEQAEVAPEASRMGEPELPAEAMEDEEQFQKLTGTPQPTAMVDLLEGDAEGQLSGGIGEADAGEQQLEGAALETPAGADAPAGGPSETAGLSPLRWLQAITGALFIVLSLLTVTIRKRRS